MVVRFFLMPEDALFYKLVSRRHTFEVKKNESGELSFIQFDCVAKSITEARHAFIRAALPFLDHLAYVAKLPVFSWYLCESRIKKPPDNSRLHITLSKSDT